MNLLGLVVGLVAGIVTGTYGLGANNRETPGEVLAEVAPTPSPTPSPNPQPTATPRPKPTPTPTPIPVISAPADLEPIFNEAATKYSVNANLLKKIAKCESRFNRGVVSKNGLYVGLFQFAVPMWSNQRVLMGADPNPDLRFGARESIETAAYAISRWGTQAWPVCSK